MVLLDDSTAWITASQQDPYGTRFSFAVQVIAGRAAHIAHGTCAYDGKIAVAGPNAPPTQHMCNKKESDHATKL
jgi:hypothetical protein